MMTMVLEVMVVMGAMEATMTMGSDISGVGVSVAMGITIMIILAQVRRSTRIKKAGTNAITVLALRTTAAIQVRISISTAVANISIRTAMKSTGPTHIPPTNI